MSESWAPLVIEVETHVRRDLARVHAGPPLEPDVERVGLRIVLQLHVDSSSKDLKAMSARYRITVEGSLMKGEIWTSP